MTNSGVQLAPRGGRQYSQLGQDLFVLDVLREKENGTFIEFGAGDGVVDSNTYLLETEYGWRGLLVEASRQGWARCQTARKSECRNAAVWSVGGMMKAFAETEIPQLSTLHEFLVKDKLAGARNIVSTYSVPTVSLNHLFVGLNRDEVDYVSVDVEGAEWEVMQGFDFGRYGATIWTIEHNDADTRMRMIELMSDNGYVWVFPNRTQWDDWFVRKEVWDARIWMAS